MNWLTLALLTILFYATFDLFVKLTAGMITDSFGAFIINLVATVVLVFYLAISRYRGEKVIQLRIQA